MTLSEDQQYEIHGLSTGNETALLYSAKCGCFYCREIFSPAEIEEWIDDKQGRSAICPKCGIDSIIASSQTTLFAPELLVELNKYWFLGIKNA